MYTAKITSPYKSITTLTGREQDYQIISIGGLSEPAAQINLSQMVGVEGAAFNSAKIQTRNVVFTIRINGDVEANRLELYKLFPTKEKVRFDYENGTLAVFAEGYVESVECDLFTNSETAQISIICMDPFFKADNETSYAISGTSTTVSNGGTAPCGGVFTATFSGPVNALRIQNSHTGEWIELDYAFQLGDVVRISTEKGAKSVKLTRSGTTSSIFSALKDGSVFLQIPVGFGYFFFSADGGSSNSRVSVGLVFRRNYRGA